MTSMTFQIEYDQDAEVFVAEVVQAPIGPWSEFWTQVLKAGKSERAAVQSANKAMQALMDEAFKATPLYADLMQNYPAEAIDRSSRWRSQQRRDSDLRTHAGYVVIAFEDPRLTTKFKLSWSGQEVEGTMPSETI